MQPENLRALSQFFKKNPDAGILITLDNPPASYGEDEELDTAIVNFAISESMRLSPNSPSPMRVVDLIGFTSKPTAVREESPKLFPKVFNTEEAQIIFNAVKREVPFTKVEWARGKYLPRLCFRYEPENNGTIPSLEHLRKEIERITKKNVSGIWCNLYENGDHYTPEHRDSYGSYVYTLSLGETRSFHMKNATTGETLKYNLQSGDLFYFDFLSNRDYLHSIPKTHRANVGERISIVFFCD